MPTAIFPSPIFGPVHSRRLGVSLGINLLPADGKVCSFDCIYCECGYNADRRTTNPLPSRQEVQTALENKLKEMLAAGTPPDVLSFAGNGEPTCHPHFPEIVEDTLRLRDAYFPAAKVSVFSNACFISRPAVFAALGRVDNNILKLDTVNETYIQTVNRPAGGYSLPKTIKLLQAFQGKCIIQTLFLKGTFQGQTVDNTTDKYVLPWLETIKTIAPRQVMIYTIDRQTPHKSLYKASPQELDRILSLLEGAGIYATASY
jgi:wyosine [tRNA(Phe)-imidazoG37] synthetase (radical SAM superfamily)